jgi:hypothetical protein
VLEHLPAPKSNKWNEHMSDLIASYAKRQYRSNITPGVRFPGVSQGETQCQPISTLTSVGKPHGTDWE